MLIDNKDGTVTDTETRLMWKHAVGPFAWNEAVEYCKGLGDGWRLPTVQELVSIFDYSKHIAETPGLSSIKYWSCNLERGRRLEHAWFFDIDFGVVDTMRTDMPLYARAVWEEC